MSSYCMYGGVSPDSIYQIVLTGNQSDISLGPVQQHTVNVAGDVVDQNVTTTTKTTPDDDLIKEIIDLDVNERDLCYIGWRLLVIQNASLATNSTSESKKMLATYHRQHIYVVSGERMTIKCLCLDQDCRIEHSAVQCQQEVIGLSCTDNLLLYHTDEGNLWRVTDMSTQSPQRILISDRKVRQVSCGKEHTVVLTTLGQVYTFGGGSRAQLGHGCLESLTEPRVVDTLSGIYVVEVRGGGWHTLVLSDIGDLYSWGWNESGQVGLPCLKDKQGCTRSSEHDGRSMIVFPSLLFEDDEDITVVDISCGSRHSAAVTDDGRLFTWGWNAYGQLLTDSTISVQDSPTPVAAKSRLFKSVHCGGWSTLAYNITPIQEPDNSSV